MSIRLKAATERAIQQELANGSYNSADELILYALSLLQHSTGRGEDWSTPEGSKKRLTAAQAVAAIRELSKEVRLDGLKIKDLINEGRD